MLRNMNNEGKGLKILTKQQKSKIKNQLKIN